jgi:transcription factor TFIIIB component B''
LTFATHFNFHYHRERWAKEETDLFFRALRHFGTDFTLIAQLFPKRDRKHIKNKVWS